jgi:ribosome-associated heat shock protein Hsp15
MSDISRMRIDKWLWCVRLFKTRSISATAVKGGTIRLNDAVVKPSRELVIGDVISFRKGILFRKVEVKALLKGRVGAKLVEDYVIDLTPPEEYEKQKLQSALAFGTRDKGTGRPTKKDRRDLEEWGEWDAEE